MIIFIVHFKFYNLVKVKNAILIGFYMVNCIFEIFYIFNCSYINYVDKIKIKNKKQNTNLGWAGACELASRMRVEFNGWNKVDYIDGFIGLYRLAKVSG